MIEILGPALFFLFGFLAGSATMITFLMHLGRKSEIKGLKEKIAKKDSINGRLKRVKEITAEQLNLQGHASGPQKNALHGRHKNGIIGQIKALEEEKDNILRSILKDGHDPELTTMDETGTVHQMKLSEYMVYMGITMEPKEEVKPQEPKAKQLGKFTVHKGGKDDGGGETTH